MKLKLYIALALAVAFFLRVGLLAGNPEKLMDIREIMERAESALFQNGVTKTVSEQPLPAGIRTTTTYYYKNSDNDNITYIESKLVPKRRTTSSVKICRPDGNWSLRSGVAIREPDELVRVMRDDNIFHRDSKPVMGMAEECMEDGVSYVRLSLVLSSEDKKKFLHKMEEISKQTLKQGEDATAKKAKEIASQSIPHKFEYLIGKDTGLLVATRVYTEKGRKLNETKLSKIEQGCDIPLSDFDIPNNFRMIFPDNASEYLSMVRKYMDARDTTTQKNTTGNQK
jgi:hypothetical protein